MKKSIWQNNGIYNMAYVFFVGFVMFHLVILLEEKWRIIRWIIILYLLFSIFALAVRIYQANVSTKKYNYIMSSCECISAELEMCNIEKNHDTYFVDYVIYHRTKIHEKELTLKDNFRIDSKREDEFDSMLKHQQKIVYAYSIEDPNCNMIIKKTSFKNIDYIEKKQGFRDDNWAIVLVIIDIIYGAYLWNLLLY